MINTFVTISLLIFCVLFLFVGCSSTKTEVDMKVDPVIENTSTHFNNLVNGGRASYGLDEFDNKCYFFDSTKTIPSGGEGSYSVQKGVIDGYDIDSGEKSSTIQNFNGWGPRMTISEDGFLYYTHEGISACAVSKENVEGRIVYRDSTIGHLMGFYILGDKIGVYNVTDTSYDSQTQGQNCNITFNLIDTASGKATTL